MDTVCPACGAKELALAVDTEPMLALARRARAFHRARLRSQNLEELDERASFTQDERAALLGCNACWHLLRWPQPDADAMVRDYADDDLRFLRKLRGGR